MYGSQDSSVARGTHTQTHARSHTHTHTAYYQEKRRHGKRAGETEPSDRLKNSPDSVSFLLLAQAKTDKKAGDGEKDRADPLITGQRDEGEGK